MKTPEQLTRLSAQSIQPAFSPNGQCLVFTSGRSKIGQKSEVYIMDACGDNLRKIPSIGDEASGPIFDWAGGLIAYSSDIGGEGMISDSVINIVDIDGKLIKQSTYPGIDYVFSPTGQYFVYSTGVEIYIEALQESEAVRLTNTYDFMQPPVIPAPRNRRPMIHPLENYIVFTSSRDRPGRDEVYIMKMNGTHQTRLTFTENGTTSPLFSPNGTEIYFLSANSVNHSVPSIFKVNYDGTDVIALPNSQGVYGDVSLSFNGEWLLYTSYSNEERKVTSMDISLMNVHTNVVYKLVSDGFYNRHPCFSPDLHSIVYCSRRDNITELYKLDIRPMISLLA